MADSLDKKIEEIIQQYFQNNSNIESLAKCSDCKKKLYDLINALTTKFCMINNITLLDEEMRNKVLNIFAKKIQDLSKELHLAENFSFNREFSKNKFTKLVESSAMINSKKLKPISVSVDISIANEFLFDYQQRLLVISEDIKKYENELEKKISNQRKIFYTNKLQEINKEHNFLTNIINEITSREKEFVTISIPIILNKDTFKDITKRQIDTIIKADVSQIAPNSITDFKLLQKDLVKLHKSLNLINKKINDFIYKVPAEDLEVSNLNVLIEKKDYLTAINLSQKIFKSLTNDLNKIKLEIPLALSQIQCINSLIKMHSLLSSKTKDSALIKAYIKEMDNLIDLNSMFKILNENETLSNIKLLEFDKSKDSFLSKNLKKGEAKFIELFEKLTKNEINTDAEKTYLGAMLERAIGNKNLNRNLRAFAKEKNNFSYNKLQYAVNDIKYFSYKTRHADKIMEINKKCKKNLSLLNAEQTIEEFEKLSQFEYGILSDMAKMKERLDEYNEKGAIPKIGNLANLYKECQESYRLIKQINEHAVAENRYCPGDILMVHSKKSLASKDKKADTETILTHSFVSKYGHAAQIYINIDNQPCISHIYGSYQVDKVQAQDIATSEIFRVDASKLVSEETASILSKLYKERGNWESEVNKIYQKIMQDIHHNSQERFELIKNDKSARFKAGLASFGLYGGHNTKNQDLEQVYESILGLNDRSIKKKMICSEFVAKSTVAALIELNETIIRDLDEKGITYSNKNIIEMPISKYESLEKIHPQRLIRLLNQTGCLEEIKPNNIINRLISRDRLKKEEKSKGLTNDLYRKMNILANTAENVEQFIEKGKIIFEVYMDKGDIIKDLDKEEISAYLNSSLKEFYKRYDKNNATSFRERFKILLDDFAEWLGVKDSPAKNIIKNNIRYIDAIHKGTSKILPLSQADRAKETLLRGKLCLEEIKRYDLLDNLSDIKKILSLNDVDLRMLHQLVMIEPMINYCTDELSISSMHKKIVEKKINNREEMLRDIKAMLSERDKDNYPSLNKINIIKFSKANRELLILEDQIKPLISSSLLDLNLRKELTFTINKIKLLQEDYLFQEIIHDVVSKGKDDIYLLNIYKRIGEFNPLQAVKNDLLEQCRAHNNLAISLETADDIGTFKNNLLNELKQSKTKGIVNRAASEIDRKSTKSFKSDLLASRASDNSNIRGL